VTPYQMGQLSSARSLATDNWQGVTETLDANLPHRLSAR
jgi:hypothetical protein